MSNINWTDTCCAWHGQYAEHPTKDGGVARLKRTNENDEIFLVCRFDSNNAAIDVDSDGVPFYAQMHKSNALKLLV